MTKRLKGSANGLAFDVNDSQEIADSSVAFDRVPEVSLANDAVMVLPSHLLALDASFFFQVSDNSLHRAFRNADHGGNFAKHDRRIVSQQNQHMRVIGQEGPMPARVLGAVRWALGIRRSDRCDASGPPRRRGGPAF